LMGSGGVGMMERWWRQEMIESAIPECIAFEREVLTEKYLRSTHRKVPKLLIRSTSTSNQKYFSVEFYGKVLLIRSTSTSNQKYFSFKRQQKSLKQRWVIANSYGKVTKNRQQNVATVSANWFPIALSSRRCETKETFVCVYNGRWRMALAW
jgi:hypothetical protein